MPRNDPPAIVRELHKVSRLAWTRVQDDNWNHLCLFVYTAQTLCAVEEAALQAAMLNKLPIEFIDYAVTRWYTFKTHNLAVDLFCQHPRVKRWPNPRDRAVDFELDGVPFDLKLTHVASTHTGRFPLKSLQTCPDDYIHWLYKKQSRQERYGINNRLFVVCYDAGRPEEGWKLKRDWQRLSGALSAYLENPTYHSIKLAGGTHVVSDVVLVSK